MLTAGPHESASNASEGTKTYVQANEHDHHMYIGLKNRILFYL